MINTKTRPSVMEMIDAVKERGDQRDSLNCELMIGGVFRGLWEDNPYKALWWAKLYGREKSISVILPFVGGIDLGFRGEATIGQGRKVILLDTPEGLGANGYKLDGCVRVLDTDLDDVFYIPHIHLRDVAMYGGERPWWLPKTKPFPGLEYMKKHYPVPGPVMSLVPLRWGWEFKLLAK